jgi:hypothetical protein
VDDRILSLARRNYALNGFSNVEFVGERLRFLRELESKAEFETSVWIHRLLPKIERRWPEPGAGIKKSTCGR